MIPIYIFYSMFGFQRTGDAFWAAGDQMTRGFVLGATAGRTTLNGEGLQHEDGHSLLLASTNPAGVSYDPAFSFELGHIIQDALRRMYGEKPEDIFYYLTVYNEPYVQPAEPEDVDVEGILRGMHRYAPARRGRRRRRRSSWPPASRCSGRWRRSGCCRRLERAGRRLVGDLLERAAPRRPGRRRAQLHAPRRRAAGAVRHARRSTARPARSSRCPTSCARCRTRSRRGCPGDFSSLGTDGFGLSDTRGALRRHFKVDAASIAVKVLGELAKRGEVKPRGVREAIDRYQLADVNAAPTAETEGGAE